VPGSGERAKIPSHSLTPLKRHVPGHLHVIQNSDVNTITISLTRLYRRRFKCGVMNELYDCKAMSIPAQYLHVFRLDTLPMFMCNQMERNAWFHLKWSVAKIGLKREGTAGWWRGADNSKHTSTVESYENAVQMAAPVPEIMNIPSYLVQFVSFYQPTTKRGENTVDL
jgi:hypothetical protein